MSLYKFRGALSLIEGKSLFNNKWGDTGDGDISEEWENPRGGENPRVATKRYFFVNTITEETFSVTDLHLQKQRRNRVLQKMRETYSRLISAKKISTIIIVAPVEQYKKPSDFLKEFKKKLIRHNISLLGYYWQRDIGDNKFECHYHIILFLKKITGAVYRKLFKRKKGKYEAEFCDSLSKFKEYLKKKEIYAPEKKRSYGCSREFKKP
jgi:hypothetical protein